ncbi:hypothetical protein [Streptomyces sp. H51]|uniref:hypothetical protein n=1 Tax=Streptomyces sp. H51 TaxID=3111770 RepID=UPI002D771BE4|nr:hypothetical protein [Streptomyces sp. H51]
MNVRTRATVALSTAALGMGLALGTPAAAAPAPAGAVTAAAVTAPATGTAAAPTADASADTSVALRTRACTRLRTQRSYGYADVCKTWYPQSGFPGRYHGTLWGTVHHYHAPANRQVVVQASIDGRKFLLGATYGNKSFSNKYRYTRKALMRLCLHRPGGGVSYCGGWW